MCINKSAFAMRMVGLRLLVVRALGVPDKDVVALDVEERVLEERKF